MIYFFSVLGRENQDTEKTNSATTKGCSNLGSALGEIPGLIECMSPTCDTNTVPKYSPRFSGLDCSLRAGAKHAKFAMFFTLHRNTRVSPVASVVPSCCSIASLF